MNDKYTVSEINFTIAYMFFIISLFNRDVSNPNVFFVITNTAKYISLVVLIATVISNSVINKQLYRILVLLGISLLITLQSGVMYFIIFVLLTYASRNIDNKFILKIALFTIVTLTILTIFFCLLGIYTDEITCRWEGSAIRHSFGFYHSNVLPLIFLYSTVYYCLIMPRKMNLYKLFFFVMIDFGLFFLCGSRNSLLLTALIVFVKYYVDRRKQRRVANELVRKIIGIGARLSVFFWGAISLIIPLLLHRIPILNIVDYINSYRFSSIKAKLDVLGVSIFPKMTNDQYFKDLIVVDNGYAFIAIRYGLIVLLFLALLVYSLGKTYKNNTFVLCVIIIVSLANLIDNDIFDYCCLPFIIIGLKSVVTNVRKYQVVGET